jgi:NAD(P)-dependent dehydrogenase (short-subunit alcohol dehydrogenase family)
LDTSDPADAAEQVEKIAHRLGGLYVFVNNSGTGDNAPFLELGLDQWRHTIAVDLDGAFSCMQRAAQLMVKAGRGGRIIAVTSVHEHQPRVGSAAYDAAKHGLGGLIKTMALELGRHKITCNAVAPGEIATPMTGQTDEDVTEKDRPGIPLARPGDAWEIAHVIDFLASGRASYVTGASWVVDGGMLQMGPQAGSHLADHTWRKG